MIKIVEGNLLNATEDIIAHQVNSMGVMDSGLAKQIRAKYPNIYTEYLECISRHHKYAVLGTCQIVKADENKFVANLFGQYNYGKDKQYTDYLALEEALLTLKVNCKDGGLSVAIPYNLGCGLAGGQWYIVYKIIEDIFKDYDVTIYKFQ